MPALLPRSESSPPWHPPPRISRWLPLLVTVSLLATLQARTDGVFGPMFWMVHLSLFLLWQPLWSPHASVGKTGGALLVLLGGSALWWPLPLLLLLWLPLLMALLTSQSLLASRWQRLQYAAHLAALLLMLLAVVVPEVAVIPLALPAQQAAMAVAWVLPGLSLLVAWRGEPRTARLDFLHGLLVLLSIIGLVLGSLVLHTIGRMAYLEAVVVAVLGLAGLCWLLAMLWRPSSLFGGIGLWLSSYLANLETPFEVWLGELTDLAARDWPPEVFLKAALEQIHPREPLTGIRWKRRDGPTDQVGEPSPHTMMYQHPAVEIHLFGQHRLSAALQVHLHLCCEVIVAFYNARCHAFDELADAYLRALHESGARHSHDMKNVLQTLRSLLAVVQSSDGREAEALELLRRQLPALSGRLEHTLTQLGQPQPQESGHHDAEEWYQSLQARYASDAVLFHPAKIRTGDPLHGELFDCVADNLLRNALRKRLTQPDMGIEVRLLWQHGVVLEVRDLGAPIEAGVAAALFQRPVPREGRMGVGLYQAAELARQHGYQLELLAPGERGVTFRLAPRQNGAAPSS